MESFQQKPWEPPELSTLGNASAIIEEIWLSRLEEHVFMNRDGESGSGSGLGLAYLEWREKGEVVGCERARIVIIRSLSTIYYPLIIHKPEL